MPILPGAEHYRALVGTHFLFCRGQEDELAGNANARKNATKSSAIDVVTERG